MRLAQKQCLKDIAQEIQSPAVKVTPFCFIPDGTSIPDVEEIQDSKREF